MKKNLPVIAIGCVLIIGVCILLYPVVSAILAKMTQSTTISSYQRAVKKLSNENIVKMKEEAHEYNDSLNGVSLSDPFTNNKKLNKRYKQLLNVNEVLGYIEIPKIHVYLPIYHGSSEEVLKKGVGHLENTSLPIGGESTHAVLTGHSGLPSATLFTDLDQLSDGCVFYIHILDEALAYKVDQIKVVEPEDTDDLTIVKGKDFVTLVTCTPYGINTQRLLVRGTRIAYVSEHKPIQMQLELVSEVVIVPTVLICIVVLPIVLLIRKKKRGNHEKI